MYEFIHTSKLPFTLGRPHVGDARPSECHHLASSHEGDRQILMAVTLGEAGTSAHAPSDRCVNPAHARRASSAALRTSSAATRCTSASLRTSIAAATSVSIRSCTFGGSGGGSGAGGVGGGVGGIIGDGGGGDLGGGGGVGGGSRGGGRNGEGGGGGGGGNGGGG